MGHSAIVIPVPELEPVVLPRLRRGLPAYLFADPAAVHAHITLLGPFVDRDRVDEALLGRLRGFFQTTARFDFSLPGTPHRLADGTVCLRPEPAGPFQALTGALYQAYPDFPPYGDPALTPLPHLTLAYPWAGGPAPVDLAAIGAEVAAAPAGGFPVRTSARRACLNWYAPYQSEPLACFDFGGPGEQGRA